MQKIIFIFLLLSPALFSACVKDKDKPEEMANYINVGDKLPEFTVKNTDGEELKSQDFTGRVTLLVFFMTTCPDCQRELPKIEQVWENLKENPDFRLVPIARAEKAEVISQFWEKHQFEMPFYLDPDRQVFSLFANNTIPRIYLINRENVVTWMAIEDMSLTALQLKEKIEKLIKK
ncbi:TlpA disulfide reductase family protein [Odoribacter sp. AF15-53]|uniref:TlpA family protein disulfide reductase n=1 Tax=Odoribacter sp. AF15-53 TaxID=2292236 RepID=UPI000E4CE1E9|nr:TlpA disulfide reductase family protein [Odoribacter sp. AF15-53]RHR74730.1 TlpA family protein disulfide reductase [Odoribacter sp. AF15-53]